MKELRPAASTVVLQLTDSGKRRLHLQRFQHSPMLPNSDPLFAFRGTPYISPPCHQGTIVTFHSGTVPPDLRYNNILSAQGKLNGAPVHCCLPGLRIASSSSSSSPWKETRGMSGR
jgi:hypothetical protein